MIMCGRTAIETGKIAIVAFACFACVAVAFADSLDLAGVDKTVADITEVSGYDELTNSSETMKGQSLLIQ